MTTGGKPQPVRVITSADLVENGGVFHVLPQPALRVTGFNDAATRGVLGGAALPVYVVNGTPLESRGTEGGGAQPLYSVATRPVDGHYAIPVYVENASEWDALVQEPVSLQYTDNFTNKACDLEELSVVDAHWITNKPSFSLFCADGQIYPEDETNYAVSGMVYVHDDAAVVANQFSEITLGFISNSEMLAHALGAAVRVTDGNGYFFYVTSEIIRLTRWIDGVIDEDTFVEAYFVEQPLEIGDVFRIEAVGSTITVYMNEVSIMSLPDPSGYATGKPMLVGFGKWSVDGMFYNAMRVSRWRGGAIGGTAIVEEFTTGGAGELSAVNANWSYYVINPAFPNLAPIRHYTTHAGVTYISNTAEGADYIFYTYGDVEFADQFSEGVIANDPNYLDGYLSELGVMVRGDVAGNGYYFFHAGYGWTLGKIVNNVEVFFDGQFDLLSGYEDPVAKNSVLRLEIAGTTLTAKIDGVTVATVVDDALATGKPGLFYHRGSFTSDGIDAGLAFSSWAGGELV